MRPYTYTGQGRGRWKLTPGKPRPTEHGTQPHWPPSGSVDQEHQQVGHRLCACVEQEVEIEVATKLADVKLDAVVD